MKKLILFTLILTSINGSVFAQKVLKLGDNTGSINSSALLDLESSTSDKGILLPRADLTKITNPVKGFVAYNTGSVTYPNQGLYIYDGAIWIQIIANGGTGILGIPNGGTGVSSVTTNPTATSFAGWDANKNLSANNLIQGYATTTNSATTTTLTVASANLQFFTGTTTQTVQLPVVTTLVNGMQFTIVNNSNSLVTVKTSGSVTVQALASNTQLIITCINTAGGTGTASWSWNYFGSTVGVPYTGAISAVNLGTNTLASGAITSSGIVSGTQLTSTIANGTAPLIVTSSTAVANLTATNSVNVGITNNTATSTSVYPTFVSATTGNSNIQTSNPNLSFVPNTGVLSATKFSGTGATLTGLTSGASTDSVVTINAAGVLNKRDMYNNKSYYTINQSADSSYFTIQSINGLQTDTVKILVTANGVSYIPYTQADSDVDLGIHSISASSFIKSGGTNTQFLKADGSIDATTYYPTSNPNGYLTAATAAGINITGNAATATSATNVTGNVAIANGGTGASTASAALTNLGAAAIASPTFTGTPTLPTGTIGVTQTAGNNTTALATTAFVNSAVTAGSAFNKITSGTNATAAMVIGTGSSLTTSGTGTINATTSTNILGGNNTTLLGSIPYQSNTNITTLLSPNTTSTKKYLSQTGNGTNGAAPTWSSLSLAATDITSATGFTGTPSATTYLRGDNTWAPISSGNTTNGLTINNSGTGAASGSIFDGSAAQTISYNSIGASPLAGSSSLTTTGTISSGIWNAGAVTSSGAITGNTIVKSGGTASQILAANGSVLTAGTNITISGGTISASLSGSGISGTGTVQQVPYFNTATSIAAAANLGIAATSGNVLIGTTSDAAGTVLSVVGTTSLNGKVTLGAGTSTNPPIQFTNASAALLSTPIQGSLEIDNTGIPYYTHAAASRGVIDAEQFITLSSPYTLINQTGIQKIFNATTTGGLSVQGNTTYFFECFYSLSSLSNSNSGGNGFFGFALGGDATITSLGWHSSGIKSNTLSTAGTMQTTYNTTNSNTALVSGSGSTSGIMRCWGIIRVNGAGTIIPQVSLGFAAPAIVGANSYFRIVPVGSGTVTNVGNWN